MADLEFLRDKKNLLKKKVVIPTAISAVVLLSIGFSVGTSSAKTDLNGEKMKYVEVVKELKGAKADLKNYQSQIKDVESKAKTLTEDYEKQMAEFDEAKKITEQKDVVLAEIAELNGKLDAKHKESEKLDGDILTKKDELSQIENTVKIKKEEPKTLSAGNYTIGKDIPAGRYIATPIGRGSNFVTYDLGGIPDVNTILGSFGEPSYTFEAKEGYTLQTESSVKLTPVE